MDWLGKGCSAKVTLPSGEEIEVVTIQGFNCIIVQALNIALRLAGLAVFVMLIIGGFKYLTSAGDPKALESARKTITYAILGLVLMLAGWFILLFIKEFTGIDVTKFTFPSTP